MDIRLPDPITRFFEISNGADQALLADCFTHDAIVHDEGQFHRGPEAIGSWLQAAQEKFHYRSVPLAMSPAGDVVKVSVDVIGNFPGSPVQLEHVFRLDGGRIAALEIHA